MNEKELIRAIYEKGQGLANAIETYIKMHEFQEQGPITDLADLVDWKAHFAKALEQYDSDAGFQPEEKDEK